MQLSSLPDSQTSCSLPLIAVISQNSLMRARSPVAAVWKTCAPRLGLAPCLKASVRGGRPVRVWSGRMSHPGPTGVFFHALKWFLSLCEVQTGDAHSKSLLMRVVGPRGQRLSQTCPSDRHIYSLAERCTRECQENEEEDDEEVLLPNKSFCFTAFILWHVVRVGGLALNNGDN